MTGEQECSLGFPCPAATNPSLANKHRQGEGSEVTGFVGGDFEGKDVIVYDDLTRSGKSAVNALKTFTDHGATGGYLVLSHLAANNQEAVQALEDSPYKRIIITDSHYWSQCETVQRSKKFIVCSVANRIAWRTVEYFAA